MSVNFWRYSTSAVSVAGRCDGMGPFVLERNLRKTSIEIYVVSVKFKHLWKNDAINLFEDRNDVNYEISRKDSVDRIQQISSNKSSSSSVWATALHTAKLKSKDLLS